jgi:hypothetical protein
MPSVGAAPVAPSRLADNIADRHPEAQPKDPRAKHIQPSEPVAYFYAILRVVPRLERGECLNAGVVLFARSARYLGLRWNLDPWKLETLAPGTDPDPIEARLLAMAAVAEGHPDGGPIAGLTQAERFHWLSSPSSTVVQPSAIHTGLTTNPEATLHRLYQELVE